MAKFYVGQKVLVHRCSRGVVDAVSDMIGKICEVKGYDSDGDCKVYQEDKEDWWYFEDSDLSPITETPETLTINGVEYVRKSEPAHEWKFGDVAVHKAYGVGIVCSLEEVGDAVAFIEKETLSRKAVFTDNLTFLRRTDFSV